MRITELWRYPVKSTQGERLETAEVDDHGIVGDRQWALLDLRTDKVLTARREPRLLFAQSRLGADGRPASASTMVGSWPTTRRCRTGSATR